MVRVIIPLCLFLFIACHSTDDDASAHDQKTQLKTKIKGYWAAVGDENVSFVITDSSVFYPDHMGTYKYRLTRDSLRIRYDDFTGAYLVKMRGDDTLILTGTEQEVFIRTKK